MDAILLRKMARKSVFNFGKHELKSVEQVMVLEPEYIGFIYYHKRQISFTDDILEEMGITGKLTIKKPNDTIDENLFADWKRHYRKLDAKRAEENCDSSLESWIANEKRYRTGVKNRRLLRWHNYRKYTLDDANFYNKSKMQLLNQGKYNGK